MDDTDAVVEEYRTLREEILRSQHARLLIAGFTLAAVGTFTGFALKGLDRASSAAATFPAAMMVVSELFVIGALVLTIYHTQTIVRIGFYIAHFIEPKVPGLNYETRWRRYRMREPEGLPHLGYGLSSGLAVFYGLLSVSLLPISGAAGLFAGGWVFGWFVALVIVSLGLAVDLVWRRTRGWDIEEGWRQAARPPDGGEADAPD